MRKLICYLRDYKKESVIGPLFKLLEASFELIVPLVMARIIDVGIANEDVPYILRMGVLLLGLGVLGLVCSLTAQYFAAKAALGFGTALRADLFAHVAGLSYAELDHFGTPTLINRMTNDVLQAQTGVNLVLRLFLRSPFLVVGALVMAFFLDTRLALIFVIATPLFALVIFLVVSKSLPYYEAAQKKLDRVALLTRENLSGVRVIRAFRRQDEERLAFEDTVEDVKQTQLVTGRISALLNPMTCVLVNAAILAILWFGGKRVDTGIITQGEVIALVNYMTQILLALIVCSNLVVAFTKASASAARINEIFAVTTSLQNGAGLAAWQENGNAAKQADSGTAEPKVRQADENEIKSAARVAFEEVGFAYAGSGEEVLSDIHFSAAAGETIGVIGSTGAGKTTLISLIPRFYDATRGEVLVDGIPVSAYTFEELRAKIGVVPQRAALLQGTIRSNLQMGKADATDAELLRALTIAQAETFVAEKPEGLDTTVAQGGKNLSGGQRQRLTIARALVKQPEILILDDSASALDFATDARLRAALRTELSDTTIFLISQRVGTVRNADRILVLDDGRIVGIGTHEELRRTCPVYEEICQSQLSAEEA